MSDTQKRPIARGCRHKGRLGFICYFDDDTAEQIRARAIGYGTSFAEQVRLLVEWGLEDAKDQPPPPRRPEPEPVCLWHSDPQLDERLRTLWHQGVTTARIGAELGVSKNSVIGRAFRLRLPRRPHAIKRQA